MAYETMVRTHTSLGLAPMLGPNVWAFMLGG